MGKTINFGPFQLDPACFELRRGEESVAMEPKSFSLLCLLVENTHRVVSKEEIFEAVWPGVVVTEASLSTTIKQIRKALGDDGAAQAFVKTVRGQGYRFVAGIRQDLPVGPIPSEGSSVSLEPIGTWQDGCPVIAVLPFHLIGAEQNHRAIAEAIPSELITALSRLHWIKVIARASSFQFGSTQDQLDAVFMKLGAGYAVSGSVEQVGRRLAVSVELIDTRHHQVIWGERFEGSMDDVFAVRANIAREVSTALELRIPLSEADRLIHVPTENLSAWGHYHLGVRHMYRYNPDDNRIAENHFLAAVEMDPKFARAHAALSYTEFQSCFQHYSMELKRHRGLALEYAEKGAELDSLDPFCNLILGRAKWLFGEVEEGLNWIERSLSLNPNYSFGYYNSATLNTVLCAGELADSHVDIALTLSPLDPHLQSMYGTRALAAFVRNDMDAALNYSELAMRSPNSHIYVYMIAAAIHSHCGNESMVRYCVEQIKQKGKHFRKADFFNHFNLRDPEKLSILKSALDRVKL